MDQHSPTSIRHGVVAVIVRQSAFLVVRRSDRVEAPGKLCFPGGGIEPGESEEQAIRRELQEELGVSVDPVSRIWTSQTSWNVQLAWWLCDLAHDSILTPSPEEVAEVIWMSGTALAHNHDLLESNREFLAAFSQDLEQLVKAGKLGK